VLQLCGLAFDISQDAPPVCDLVGRMGLPAPHPQSDRRVRFDPSIMEKPVNVADAMIMLRVVDLAVLELGILIGDPVERSHP